MALYVICGKILDAFRNLFAARAHCVLPAGDPATRRQVETRGRIGITKASFPADFSADATSNQKANAPIFRGTAFHPQQIPLTHVNQLSAPPIVPVAKRSSSTIVPLTWAAKPVPEASESAHASASPANEPAPWRRVGRLVHGAWSEAHQNQGDFEWH
ncbi:hypothetical protein ATY30_16360 [Sinorhizobium americanum]|nr:hypothetical protein CO664_11880 [Sinorhizobium sp. NG07B]POH29199.1 hypothetical protein ATY30_16360 [Sinorhizobium americanum]